MAAADENKLVESLVWSTKEYSLADFVETYELPQVVCVEIGYFGESERTTLSGGQLLTLHSVRKTSRVLCEVPHDSDVLIPLNCPLKAEVHPKPKDCKHATITPDQLSTLYRHIKYVRVLAGHYNEKCYEESFEIDDILEIKQINHEKCLIKCKNVANGQKVSVPFDCMALFAPLLDHREFTLAEVKQKFGFPVKVRFSDKKAERQLRSKSKNKADSSMLVSGLGEITVREEIDETVVISTTVCASLKDKVCLQIPKDLDIQIVVAEGFMTGDQTYQRIVRTLDKGLNRTKLKDFEDLDVYQHLDAVKKSIQDMSADASVERAPHDLKRRAMERRLRESIDEGPPPSLPPKPSNISSCDTFGKASPVIPPKPGPKPIPRSRPAKPGSKVTDKFKGLSLPTKPPDWLNSLMHNRKSKSTSSSDDTGHPSSLHRYKSDGDYAGYVETIKSEAESDYIEVSDDNNYAEIEHVYEKPDCSKMEKPTKPNIPPPEVPGSLACEQTPTYTQAAETPVPDKEAIYQAIARIPQDLSGLSVIDVSKLLTNLRMSGYIKLFEEELVDGEILASMDRESLESLNVSAFHVKKLLKFINGWRPNVNILL